MLALNERMKKLVVDLVEASKDRYEEKKMKQRIKVSSVPKTNILEILKRDFDERQQFGQVCFVYLLFTMFSLSQALLNDP